MELLIKKAEFLKGLGIAHAVADTKRAMPILQNVLIRTSEQGIDLTATDLDIGVRASYEAEVRRSGVVAASARKLHDIVRELPEETVELAEEPERRLRISCGRSTFRLPCVEVEDFPPLPSYEEAEFISLDAKDFADMVRKVLFASSTDATRSALNGALLESEGKVLHLAATDGHRLAYMRKTLPAKPEGKLNALLPRKALLELSRLLSEVDEPLRLAFQKNHAIFLCKNVVLISRLLEGQFPNYHEVIPKQTPNRLLIDRLVLLNALRRVSLLANEKSHLVMFTLKRENLLLASTDIDLGEAKEEVVGRYEGEEFAAAFNARFFIEPLGVLDSANVVLHLSGALGPCVLMAENSDEFRSVIMPMRT